MAALRLLKLFLCLACFFLYLLIAFFASLILVFLKSSSKRRIISRLTQLFTRCLVRIIGVRVNLYGREFFTPAQGTGVFFASNHLGYLDGFILGSLFPITYVTKSEIRKWPLIGMMMEVSGTLFIERDKKNCVADIIGRIGCLLKDGGNVLFFPEGTSGNGEALKAFKSSFFDAPLQACAPIVPITINYKSVDGRAVTRDNRDFIFWYGEMTFADHFFRLLGRRSIDVDIRLHAPVKASHCAEGNGLRKLVCDSTFEAVSGDFKLIGDGTQSTGSI